MNLMTSVLELLWTYMERFTIGKEMKISDLVKLKEITDQFSVGQIFDFSGKKVEIDEEIRLELVRSLTAFWDFTRPKLNKLVWRRIRRPNNRATYFIAFISTNVFINLVRINLYNGRIVNFEIRRS